MIELTLLNKLMLLRQANQKSAIFVANGKAIKLMPNKDLTEKSGTL